MSDDFSTRYRLLKCVLVENGIRTHNAQELKTGKVVMVHISDAAGPDEVEDLRQQMARVRASHKPKILETATLPSGFAIVTEFLPGSLSFRSWLNEYAEPAAPPPQAPPPQAETPGGTGDKEGRIGATLEVGPFASVVEDPADFGMLPVAFEPEDNRVPPATSAAPAPAAAPEFPVSPMSAVPPAAPPSLTSEPINQANATGAPLRLSLPGTGLADSFTAIFGAPKDPKEFDDGVQIVTSGDSGQAPIKFSLNEPAASGQNPVTSPLAGVAPLPSWLTPAGGMPEPLPSNALPENPMVAASSNQSPPPAPVPPAPFAGAASAPVASTPAMPSPGAPAPKAPPGEFTMMFAPSATESAPRVTRETPAQLASQQPSHASALTPAAPVSPSVTNSSPQLVRPETNSSATVRPTLRADRSSEIPAAAARAAVNPPTVILQQDAGGEGSSAAPAQSPFGWENAIEAPKVAKAPPGEFTLMFGAPETAAPMPDQVRPSPMREAPPPAFSALTPEARMESPPVEPMHRVMSSNPSYVAGINQEGPSPISNNLSGGGYAGYSTSRPPLNPPNYSGAPGAAGQRYSGMPEFAPAPPPPAYPPAHASPIISDPQQFGGEPNSQRPGILPPPIFGNSGSVPLSALGGAAPIVNANAGPSEFTQLISHGAAPVVPELKPAAASSAAAAAAKAKPRRRLPTGLIIVINAVLLITSLLMFFVLRRQMPTKASLTPHIVTPTIPNAPQIPR